MLRGGTLAGQGKLAWAQRSRPSSAGSLPHCVFSRAHAAKAMPDWATVGVSRCRPCIFSSEEIGCRGSVRCRTFAGSPSLRTAQLSGRHATQTHRPGKPSRWVTSLRSTTRWVGKSWPCLQAVDRRARQHPTLAISVPAKVGERNCNVPFAHSKKTAHGEDSGNRAACRHDHEVVYLTDGPIFLIDDVRADDLARPSSLGACHLRARRRRGYSRLWHRRGRCWRTRGRRRLRRGLCDAQSRRAGKDKHRSVRFHFKVHGAHSLLGQVGYWNRRVRRQKVALADRTRRSYRQFSYPPGSRLLRIIHAKNGLR